MTVATLPDVENSADSKASLDEMVLAHLGIARLVARRCALIFQRVMELEDLTQDANLALVRAARDYLPSIGIGFSTYAYRMCWRACTDSLRRNFLRWSKPQTSGRRTGNEVDRHSAMELWALGDRVLSEVERQVIHARYREGLTQNEVSRQYALSRQRIAHIEGQAIAKLSVAARSRKSPVYSHCLKWRTRIAD